MNKKVLIWGLLFLISVSFVFGAELNYDLNSTGNLNLSCAEDSVYKIYYGDSFVRVNCGGVVDCPDVNVSNVCSDVTCPSCPSDNITNVCSPVFNQPSSEDDDGFDIFAFFKEYWFFIGLAGLVGYMIYKSNKDKKFEGGGVSENVKTVPIRNVAPYVPPVMNNFSGQQPIVREPVHHTGSVVTGSVAGQNNFVPERISDDELERLREEVAAIRNEGVDVSVSSKKKEVDKLIAEFADYKKKNKEREDMFKSGKK